MTLFILYMVVFLYIYCISRGTSLDRGLHGILKMYYDHDVWIGEVQSGGGLIFMVLDPSLPQCPLIKQHIIMY